VIEQVADIRIRDLIDEPAQDLLKLCLAAAVSSLRTSAITSFSSLDALSGPLELIGWVDGGGC
jgi:hypothetical protein